MSMEIRIYNRAMEFQGIIENQRSLLWNRQYYESGDFELHCPITPYNVSLLKMTNLVWKQGSVDAGIIENLHIEEDVDGNELVASGRFLPAYLDRRILPKMPGTNIPTAEMKMKAIVIYPTFGLPIAIEPQQGFTENVKVEARYKGALSTIMKIAKQAQLGFRIVPDFTAKTMTFCVYKGVDRSIGQSDRARVIFSEGFSNLNKAVYEENEQVFANVCVVGGRGEGDERQTVTVGETELTGLDRREVFINGQDISPDNITEEEYTSALEARGWSKLAECARYNSLECEAIPYGNFEYGVDYDLGDIVTIKKESWDLGENLRMTGITEVYEDGARKIQPVFGEPIPITAKWEDD